MSEVLIRDTERVFTHDDGLATEKFGHRSSSERQASGRQTSLRTRESVSRRSKNLTVYVAEAQEWSEAKNLVCGTGKSVRGQMGRSLVAVADWRSDLG